jgi:dienelactone hydrolase
VAAKTGMSAPIDGFTQFDFADGGIEHAVYRNGGGPGVLIMHEVPGLTPQCIDLANRIGSAGYTVFLPLLFGEPNSSATVANTLRVCVSREFKCFALNESSPISVWLRALGQRIYGDLNGNGIGVIGLCLTGGFVLSLMADSEVLAPAQIFSPSNSVLIIGRVLVESDSDLPTAHSLTRQIQFSPLTNSATELVAPTMRIERRRYES